ncbi:Phytochrome-like protein cph1 [Marinibacterium anthonyi]|nr:Phytochrome-like protein cph1 [Marinibacterium anthonyi]
MAMPAPIPRRLWIWAGLALIVVVYVPALVAIWDLRNRQRDDIGVLTHQLPELLLDFELAIGYSGFIHDFKNAVLRGDEPRYADGVRDSYDTAMSAVLTLEHIAGDVGLDIDMSPIRDTLNQYRRALIRVEHAHRQGLSAEEIDALVRIPDTAATLNLVTAHEAIQNALLERTATSQRDMMVLLAFVATLLLLLPGTVIALMWAGMREQTRRLAEIRDLNHVLDDRNSALQRANADLTLINGKLNEFAYVTAHDLRVPMRGIANHASFLMEDHGDTLEPDARNRLMRMQDLCAQVENLTATLLKYSRIDRSATMEEVRVEGIVANIHSALAELLDERHGKIVIDTPLPRLQASAAEVNTVLHNLVLNGLVYSDAEHPTVHIGYAPHVWVDGRLLRQVFYVSDNGIGIAPEFHDEVFRMFKRLNHPDAYGPGSGAGLAFVRKVTESMGGEVVLVSRLGEGCTFYIDFGDASAKAPLSFPDDMPLVQHA